MFKIKCKNYPHPRKPDWLILSSSMSLIFYHSNEYRGYYWCHWGFHFPLAWSRKGHLECTSWCYRQMAMRPRKCCSSGRPGGDDRCQQLSTWVKNSTWEISMRELQRLDCCQCVWNQTKQEWRQCGGDKTTQDWCKWGGDRTKQDWW